MEEFRKKFVRNGRVISGTWKDKKNHTFFAECLGKELGYTEQDDWYKLRRQLVRDNNGAGLISRYYSDSTIQFVKAMFPDFHFLEWMFKQVSHGYWKNKNNHKVYADWLGMILNYTSPQDWYGITKKEISDNNGCGLLDIYYSSSPIQFVRAMFPDFAFFEWKFSSVPQNFWDSKKNHKVYAGWLGSILGYTCPEDWYRINGQLIKDNNGGGLLATHYSASPILFVRAVFPDVIFLEWKFAFVSTGFWETEKNHKVYADWLGSILGYTCPEDWYRITIRQISDNYGGGLLVNYYSGSPIQFVRAMFPDIVFLEWKFLHTPHGFWENKENHKVYADWLGSILGYTCPEDWYKLTRQQIKDNNGAGLIAWYYSDSRIQFVRAMFPDVVFLEWQFGFVSRGFWVNKKNHKLFADWLGNILGYTCPEDWYRITKQQVIDHNGSGLLQLYYSSSPAFVKAMFPEYPWVSSKFRKSYSRGQIEWLEYLMVSTPDIRHALHEEGEMKIPNSRYSADGYSEVKNCIYEYHGDFWHGNPAIYPSLEINPVSKVTYGELYEKTLEKQKFCEEESGYSYYFVWESSWIRGKIAVMNLQRMYRKKKE